MTLSISPSFVVDSPISEDKDFAQATYLSQEASGIDTLQMLYRNHHHWLYQWLRRKMGCAHNAADMVQDTFLRIMNSRDALLGMREPRAFLTTTAKNLLLDRARRQLLEQTYLTELAASIAQESPSYPAPEEILLALEALAQIDRALQTVSENARQAFLLHYLEGQAQSEIAVQLGVSTRMVRNYLVQALLECQLEM